MIDKKIMAAYEWWKETNVLYNYIPTSSNKFKPWKSAINFTICRRS